MLRDQAANLHAARAHAHAHTRQLLLQQAAQRRHHSRQQLPQQEQRARVACMCAASTLQAVASHEARREQAHRITHMHAHITARPAPTHTRAATHLQAVTYNKALREQIDNLRRERLMFEAIHHNMEKDLARIKRNMAGELGGLRALQRRLNGHMLPAADS